MDGTILNSIAAAERIWSVWARRHGLDVEAFLPTIHGARAVDTISRLSLSGVDAQEEALGITREEITDVEGIVPVPGAIEFLKALPADKWAVVTSAPRALALSRLAAAGIVPPDVMVTAEDVLAGKPDPACYQLAADKLGVEIAECLVFEDADVGIRAGLAAGAEVLVVTSTHTHLVQQACATIKDYARLSCRQSGDGLRLSEGV